MPGEKGCQEQRGSRSKRVPGGSKSSSAPALPRLLHTGAEAAGLRGCRQPGDAGAGPKVLKGSEGKAGEGMPGVVAAASAFPVCDRAGVACLCETRFAGTVARQKPLTGLGS